MTHSLSILHSQGRFNSIVPDIKSFTSNLLVAEREALGVRHCYQVSLSDRSRWVPALDACFKGNKQVPPLFIGVGTNQCKVLGGSGPYAREDLGLNLGSLLTSV